MKAYDLNLLVALDALLSAGSVTAAATRMHLSTPAMSHTLARIRDAFGDPIFVRAGRQLAPTPRALALAGPVRELVAQAQALRLQTGTDWTDRPRRFVVRAPEGWAVVYGAALSQAVAAKMPQASLQFLPEAHHDPDALREGRIDIDIGTFRRSESGAQSVVVSQQPLVGAARKAHPLFAGRVTLARFAASSQVDVSPRPGEAAPVDRALADAGHERVVALLVPSTFTALIAASRSDLIATAPERTARAMAAALDLRVFKLPVQVVTEPTRMTWHMRHEDDPAHQWLRDCMLRVFQGSYARRVVHAAATTKAARAATASPRAGRRQSASVRSSREKHA